MSRIAVRVSRKYQAADGVSAFELVAADGGLLPAFEAGAHIDVHVPSGPTRQYSLCGPRDDRSRYLIGVLRTEASRGGSASLSDAVEEGALLDISAPRNLFALDPLGTKARLFSAGIGITPILAMADELKHRATPFHLFYTGRTRARMPFLDRVLGDALAPDATIHVTSETGARLDLVDALRDKEAGEHLYVCGPSSFIDAVVTQAAQAGWPPGSVHREHFASADEVSADADGAFTVILAKSGMELEVPADRTVLEILLENGVDIDSSCEQGVCGTCVVPLLAGVPDHRDLFMTDAEHTANIQFTPCCSRACSPVLTLDL